MIDQVLTAIFGSKHERDVKRMIPTVHKINSLEPQVSAMSDEQDKKRLVRMSQSPKYLNHF